MLQPSRMLPILLVLCLSVISLALCLVLPAAAEEEVWMTGTLEDLVETVDSMESDPWALAEGYIQSRLYPTVRRSATVSARDSLSGMDLKVYDLLLVKIKAVAAGELTSTIFTFSPSEIYGKTAWTAAELGVSAVIADGAFTSEALQAIGTTLTFSSKTAVEALLADCPYELYWFDKTTPYSTSYPQYTANSSTQTITLVGNVTIRMVVSSDYRTSAYVINASYGTSVSAALDRASQIVKTYASSSNYDKLMAYKTEICSLVSYNLSAAYGGAAYGNPWQLVWVFDGDSTTNVVCEGYAKAFKYLCDLSSFSGSVSCVCVNGTANGSGHMWNIVCMEDGFRYLVDVTNCDAGTVGEPSYLMLRSAADGSPSTSYVLSANGTSMTYVYDATTLSLYGSAFLTLSDLPYGETYPAVIASTPSLSYTVGEAISFTFAADDIDWDGLQVRITAQSIQTSVTVDTWTGSYTYTPGFSSGGTYAFSFAGIRNNRVGTWSNPISITVTDTLGDTLGDIQLSIPSSVSLWNTLTFTLEPMNNVSSFLVTLTGPRTLLFRKTYTSGTYVTPYFTKEGLYTFSVTATTDSGLTKTVTSAILAVSPNNKITLPSGLRTISEEAFAGSGVQWVIIPSGVKTIGKRAFADNPSLAFVEIPSSVTRIATDAFDGCPYVTIVPTTP